MLSHGYTTASETHYNRQSNIALIDHVYINKQCDDVYAQVHDVYYSDHDAVYCSVPLSLL